MSKYHTVFLSREGHVYSCGHGFGGRLGHGDESSFVVRSANAIPTTVIFSLEFYYSFHRHPK